MYVSGSIPTGMELNPTQWRMMTTLLLVSFLFLLVGIVADINQQRQLIPLCILAFQGLSSGNIDTDSQPIKFMVHEGLPVVVIQSFDAVSLLSIHIFIPNQNNNHIPNQTQILIILFIRQWEYMQIHHQ